MKHNKAIMIITVITLGILTMAWAGCNKKAEYVAPIVPGTEPLTTLELDVVNVNDPKDVDTCRWIQLNSNGGPIDYSQAHMTLRSNASYRVYVRVLDTLTDITPEIRARQNFHLVCFDANGSLYNNFTVGLGASGYSLSITREDYDSNKVPLPVGLIDSFVTGADSSAGILETTLHHQPNVKDGTCPPGSIDIDATDTIYISPHKH